MTESHNSRKTATEVMVEQYDSQKERVASNVRNELQTIQKQSADMVNQAQALNILTEEDYNVAFAFRKASKALVERITEFFAEMKKKAWDAYKEIQSTEKQYSENPKTAERVLKTKMEQWQRQKDMERIEQEAKLKEVAKEKGLDEELVSIPEEPKQQGESFRTEWKFEVVDISKVPAEYLMVNEKAVGAIVKAKKDKTDIPGIKVFPYKIQVLR